MPDFTCLIPGIYHDGEGNIYVNMRAFLTFHRLPDNPGARKVVWAEMREAFGDVPIIEISE
jgi:hypothetical protein